MNRKAQGREEVPKMGIAILVLLIVILGVVVMFGGSIIDKIKVLIPGYNMTKPPIVDNEILRYDITKDKVEWYDGVKFYDFSPEGNAKVGKKNLEHETLRREFGERWYLNNDFRKKNKRAKLHPEILKNIYTDKDVDVDKSLIYSKIPLVDACIQNSILKGFRINPISILLIRKDSEQCILDPAGRDVLGKPIGGEVLIYTDGRAEIRKVSKFEYGLPILRNDNPSVIIDNFAKNEFIKVADEWKQSILEKPVSLTYQEDGKEKETKSYCVIFYKPDKLKVDLAKPVDANYKCPIEVKG